MEMDALGPFLVLAFLVAVIVVAVILQLLGIPAITG